MSSADDRRERGRPRLPDTNHRIIEATLRLLGRDGYARMSVDAIAAEAGVAKPTVYLRYPSKAALTSAALAALAASREETAPIENGCTRTELIAHLHHFQRGVGRPFGVSLVGAVLAEEHETPELLALYREQIVQPRRHMMRAVLERAEARGELRGGVDLDLAVSMMIGAYYAQYLEGTPFADTWAARTVDTILAGLLRPSAAT